MTSSNGRGAVDRLAPNRRRPAWRDHFRPADRGSRSMTGLDSVHHQRRHPRRRPSAAVRLLTDWRRQRPRSRRPRQARSSPEVAGGGAVAGSAAALGRQPGRANGESSTLFGADGGAVSVVRGGGAAMPAGCRDTTRSRPPRRCRRPAPAESASGRSPASCACALGSSAMIVPVECSAGDSSAGACAAVGQMRDQELVGVEVAADARSCARSRG